MGQFPVGSIAAIGETISNDKGGCPPGWLYCDGSAVSRTTYTGLFKAIASIYGDGDGSTTFNLPDYRGQFVRAVDGGKGIDKYAAQRHAQAAGGNTGDKVGTVQGCYTALPATTFTTDTQGAHTHHVPHLPTDKSWYYIAGSHYAEWNSGSVKSSTNGNHSHPIAGGDAESRPVNIYVNYMIYAGV